MNPETLPAVVDCLIPPDDFPGAIESARLLLNSQSSFHPAGLGNEYDQVGRNLQGHLYLVLMDYLRRIGSNRRVAESHIKAA